jgi:hypothetical protein
MDTAVVGTILGCGCRQLEFNHGSTRLQRCQEHQDIDLPEGYERLVPTPVVWESQIFHSQTSIHRPYECEPR